VGKLELAFTAIPLDADARTTSRGGSRMSDDLVKRADAFRLGSRPTDQQVDETNWLIDRMSSRIEELEAKVQELEEYKAMYEGLCK
jgi:hypothetical protein